MPLVLRLEKPPAARTPVLEAAAAAALAVCLDPRAEPGGEWHEAVSVWMAGRIRKIARRARGVHWEAVQELPGVTWTVGAAQVRALVPGPVDDVPRVVSRLQIGGTDVERDDPGPPGHPVIWVNAALELTVGKAAAQVGHASMLYAAARGLTSVPAFAVRHRHVPGLRTDDVVAITDGLVALHSTDPVTVYLSAAARMRTPSLGVLESALYEQRSLIRHHAMRRTLWIFGHEAARLAHHAATVAVAKVQRRNTLVMLADGGIPEPERWLADADERVHSLLVDKGPLTAREVGVALPELAVPLEFGSGRNVGVQAAHTRVLLLLGFSGRVLRARPTGTWINGAYRWAAAEHWLPGGFGEGDVRTAAAGLVRRWLYAFGPATRTDLQWWMGWTVATTTAALADVGAVEVALDEGPGWVLPDDVDAVPAPEPSARLLPGLDPSTMGWKQRAFHLDAEHVPQMFDRNGNGGPAVWVDGRIVGGWVQRRDGTIAVKLLADVGAEARAELERHAHELEALLGEVRFSVRYPAPMQAELMA